MATAPSDMRRTPTASIAYWLRDHLRVVVRPRTIVIGTVIALIGYLVVVPLYYLLWGTFFGAHGFTLDSFARAYGDPQAPEMIVNSVVYALGSTVLALVLGCLLAYVNVRTDAPFKALFFAGALVPFIIPAILYAPAWAFLASPDIGLLNVPLNFIFGRPLFDVYSLWGMIWVEGLHLVPIAFLLMAASFRSMDPSLEESAQMCGVHRLAVFRRITIPVVRPALTSAALVTMVLALESFEVPAMIGLQGGIYVFTSRIYFLLSQYPVDFAAAGALGVGLLVLAMAGVLLSNLANKDTSRYQTVTGRAFRPHTIELGRARPLIGCAVILYFLITVVAPLLALLYASLLSFYQTPSLQALRSLTLDNYRAVMNIQDALTALVNTVVLGLGSGTVVMVLTAVAGWVVVRSGARGRWLVDGLAFVPIAIPGLVLGLALLFVYLRVPLPIYGSLWILLIAYSTRFLPYGMRYASAAMYQVGDELEESAHMSGATWLQSFRRVVVPLISPGVLAGWMFVLMMSFRELSSSIVIYSPGEKVLSILIFEQYQDGQFTIVAAIGILMILILVVLILIAYKVGSRIGVRMD